MYYIHNQVVDLTRIMFWARFTICIMVIFAAIGGGLTTGIGSTLTGWAIVGYQLYASKYLGA